MANMALAPEDDNDILFVQDTTTDSTTNPEPATVAPKPRGDFSPWPRIAEDINPKIESFLDKGVMQEEQQ